jgi:uncharacterized coiled-coil DUF342 family protein
MSYTTKQYMAKISELNQQLISTLASLAEMKGQRDALKDEINRQHEIILSLSKIEPPKL